MLRRALTYLSSRNSYLWWIWWIDKALVFVACHPPFCKSWQWTADFSFFGRSDADKRTSSNDAQETLSGHAGRVICIKTAWHGDAMLSGGADKTVRLWGFLSTGKCLLTFEGHSCWVTQTHYWCICFLGSVYCSLRCQRWNTSFVYPSVSQITCVRHLDGFS
jgi:WD40 repeat protein